MCKVCELIKSIDSYSVEYLSWITGIVGGIITVATIVFTHYNEKSIEKSNEFVEEIRGVLYSNKNNKENLPYKDIASKFNKVIQALSNNHIYKTTLLFFEIILYVLVVLWSFGSLGYALNSESWTEKIFIITASLILIGVFLFIPEIIKGFNKNKILVVTNKNKCSLNEALKFFEYENILGKREIISHIISPNMNIFINNKDNIVLEFNQGLSIMDYFIIFQLVNDNETIYISLNIDSDSPLIKYDTNQNIDINFSGVYDLIKTSKKTKGNVYIYNNLNMNKHIFKISNSYNDEDRSTTLGIKNIESITNVEVDKIYAEKASLIKVISSSPNEDKVYSLIKVI